MSIQSTPSATPQSLVFSTHTLPTSSFPLGYRYSSGQTVDQLWPLPCCCVMKVLVVLCCSHRGGGWLILPTWGHQIKSPHSLRSPGHAPCSPPVPIPNESTSCSSPGSSSLPIRCSWILSPKSRVSTGKHCLGPHPHPDLSIED